MQSVKQRPARLQHKPPCTQQPWYRNMGGGWEISTEAMLDTGQTQQKSAGGKASCELLIQSFR